MTTKLGLIFAFVILIIAMIVDFVSNYVVNPLTFIGTLLVGIILVRMKIDDGGQDGRQPTSNTPAERV